MTASSLPTQLLTLAPGLCHVSRVPIHAESPFASTPRSLDAVRGIVLHESAGCGWNPLGPDSMEQHLRRKGYGVHFDVGEDVDGSGLLIQHNPLTDQLVHAGAANAWAVAIEVRTCFCPPARKPWTHLIQPAPWAHKGAYVASTPDQVEAAHQLILSLCDALDLHPLRDVPALRGPDLDLFDLNPLQATPRGGILAHKHLGAHSDGIWPLLYHVLRAHGLAPSTAYERGLQLLQGARRAVTLTAALV